MKIHKYSLMLTVLGFVLLNSSTSLSQPNWEHNDMTKFDIQEFNQNKKGDFWDQTFTDGTTISRSKLTGIGYLVVITSTKHAFRENKAFNFQGELVGTAQFFHSFLIGTSINYDGKGNIISKEVHDQAFPFSLDDVAKKMRSELKIDIMNREAAPIVARSVDQTDAHIPYYIVYATDPDNRFQRIAYLIHGSTGEILFIKTTDIYRDDGVVLRSYAESLNQKKLKQK